MLLLSTMMTTMIGVQAITSSSTGVQNASTVPTPLATLRPTTTVPTTTAPTTSPTTSPSTFQCFESHDELAWAVYRYIHEWSPSNSKEALRYGYPMGTWCFGEGVTSLDDLFLRHYGAATFQEDLSAWDVSRITSMTRTVSSATSGCVMTKNDQNLLNSFSLLCLSNIVFWMRQTRF